MIEFRLNLVFGKSVPGAATTFLRCLSASLLWTESARHRWAGSRGPRSRSGTGTGQSDNFFTFFFREAMSTERSKCSQKVIYHYIYKGTPPKPGRMERGGISSIIRVMYWAPIKDILLSNFCVVFEKFV